MSHNPQSVNCLWGCHDYSTLLQDRCIVVPLETTILILR